MPDKEYYPDALAKRIAQMFTFTPMQANKTNKPLIARLKIRPQTGTIIKMPEIK
ncbi:hypothetical protein [Shewanella sp.]|jgi:hypothetical protein|uniref:hypothetical protein n=1 Tax=Shewanella sp. TaxID=50422 RepID=UPI00356505C9